MASFSIPYSFGTLRVDLDPISAKKAEKLITGCPSLFKESYKLTATQYAQRAVRVAKACLNKGMPPSGSGVSWPPHSAHTIKRIGEHTLLNWSGQYRNHIRVVRFGRTIAAGVPSSTMKTRPDGQASHQRLATVAKFLEFGSEDGKLPERPMWTVMWDSIGGRAKYTQLLVKNLRKLIRNIR